MTPTPRQLLEALFREIARDLPSRPRLDLIAREIVNAEPRLRWVVRMALLNGYLRAARETARQAMREGAVMPASTPGKPLPPPSPPERGGASPGDNSPSPYRFPGVEAAADWLQRRQLLTHDDFHRLDDQAKKAAFTIARVKTVDAVKTIRDAVGKAHQNGGVLRDFREDVKDAVKGVFSPAQVETLYRSHVGLAQAAGQRAVIEHPAVEDEFPYRMWSSVGDARTRETHRAMETHGPGGCAVYRADDPMWETLWPPCEWNCVLPGTKVEGEFLGAVRSYYRGKAVKIVTKSGAVIRVTSKHPVLTENGWVNAGTVKKGNQLFRHVRHREVIGDFDSVVKPNGRTPQVHNGPTPIEEVFRSFAARGFSERHRTKAGDFHGEAKFFQGDVQTVWADRRLLGNLEPVGSDHVGDFALKRAKFGPVGGGGLLRPVSVAHPLPLDVFRFGLTAKLDAMLLEVRRNHGTGNADPFGDLINRVARDVTGLDFGHVRQSNGTTRTTNNERHRFPVGSQFDTGPRKHAAKAGFADASVLAQPANRFARVVTGNDLREVRNNGPVSQNHRVPSSPGFDARQLHVSLENTAGSSNGFGKFVHPSSALVERDEIVEVVNFDWCGHVYDLQSRTGVIVAESLLIANCRCLVIPLSIEDAARHGSREAARWLATGTPPANPVWAKQPYPVIPPEGWPVHTSIVAVV